MTKAKFLAQLRALLAALPAEEREDALRYYEDFFDAAGPDNEAETLAELGSPAAVADKILAGREAPPEDDTDTIPGETPPEPPAYHYAGDREDPGVGANTRRARQHFPGIAVAGIVLLAVVLLVRGVSWVSRAVAGNGNTAAASLSEQAVASSRAAETTETASAAAGVGSMPMDTRASESFSAGAVSDLEITIGAGKLNILHGDGAEIKLTATYDATWAPLDCTLRDGTLRIDYQRSGPDGSGAVKANERSDFTLYLPQDFQFDGDAELSTGIGNVEIGDLCAGTINLGTGTGDVRTGALTADTAAISTGTGKLDCADLEVGDLTLSTGTGTLSTGALTVGTAVISTGTGAVTIGQLTAAESVECSSGTGKLVIGRMTSPDSEVTTGTGGAKLTLAGSESDYTFTNYAGLGSLVLGDRKVGSLMSGDEEQTIGSGPNKMRLSTGLGSLEIDFER